MKLNAASHHLCSSTIKVSQAAAHMSSNTTAQLNQAPEETLMVT